MAGKNSENPYKFVGPVEELNLLNELHTTRAQVLFKFQNSKEIFKARAEEKSWGRAILAARPARLDYEFRDQIATCFMTLDKNVYFFHVKVRIQLKQIHLELTDNIQQLVRRKNNRFAVPADLPFYFYTKRIGEKILYIRADVKDISEKGCRLVLNSLDPKIQVDQKITGDLRLMQKKAIGVTSTVRHVTKGKFGEDQQTFGLEFTQVEDQVRFLGWLLEVAANSIS